MGGSCPPPQSNTGTMLRTLANIRVVLVAVLLLGTACAARKCGICGKEGHNRATCPQRPGAVAVLPSPLPGMRPPHAGSPAPDPVAPPTVLPAAPGARAPRKCSHCHQPGHNVATCQQAAAQRTAAAATAATAVAALTAATGVARRPRARLGWRPWPVRHRPGGCATGPGVVPSGRCGACFLSHSSAGFFAHSCISAILAGTRAPLSLLHAVVLGAGWWGGCMACMQHAAMRVMAGRCASERMPRGPAACPTWQGWWWKRSFSTRTCAHAHYA